MTTGEGSDQVEVAAAMPPVTVRVFGGMGLESAEVSLSIGGPRQRRLLALLALRNGSIARVDWLAESLWDDADRPDATAPAIRTYMSRLRQALPEEAQDWLGTESSGYLLNAPPSALEHLQFKDLRAQATSARGRDDPLSAIRLLDEALALWRGDPFQELEDTDVARATVEQLQLDRLEMLEERWESALALGRHTQITGELAVFAGEHRLRDRATRQYALALHRSGRSPEGLRVIAAHREFLLDESGLDPSSEMLDLEQAMLAGDDSLEVEKVGRPLRGYRLLDEIGSGAFSVVWRGVQPSVGREVAIKQIRSELASQPEFIRRFEAEARLVARIEHPHIVPLIDFWRDPDSAYLVMRLLRGDTLERRLDDGPLTIDETLKLAQQIGGALSAAHAHNIIHRDVKTGNIMFDESGNAFLGDFGIALEASESTGPDAAFSTGSPAYSAPEQLRQEPLGPPADVFSLGVVLFECLTGTLPFADSGSVPALVERQLHSEFPPVTNIRSEVPRQIADAIAKATANAATDRFDTVSAFVAALGSATVDQALGENPSVDEATDLTNPYLGLGAFDEADRDNFFGREALVNALLARFSGTGLASRCIGVVGPSGSGKSSVVRAGLNPALRLGAAPGSEQWFTTTMIPAKNPFASLEAALLRIAVNPPSSLLDQLQDGPRGVLRCLRRCLDSDTDKIYLVIDQFEEVFTSSDTQVAFDFLDALAVAVEDPQSPLRLVFTLRADYYDRPLGHPSFARILDATSVNVTPLSADELERAMTGPAQRLGVRFEPGLVALIVADCIGQPAPLPLLQYALSELFERRDGAALTIAAYEDMGRLTGALAGRAEAIHNQAIETQRSSVRRTFGRMINPTEQAADLRRRVRLVDLGDDTDTAWVLEQFGQARLLTFDRDPASREPTVEVAHEALLREWPRLASWLDEDREVLRSSNAVALAADAWDGSGQPDADLYRGGRLENAIGLAIAAPDRLRPVDTKFVDASRSAAEAERTAEQGRVRRLRRLVTVVGAALVVALVAGGIAFQQREDAQDATAEAKLATLISQSAAVGADDAELSILLALEAHRQNPGADTEDAVLRSLAASTLANRVSSLGPPVEETPPGCEGVALRINVYSGAATEFGQRGDQLISRDTMSGEISEHGAAPGPCVSWSGNAAADRRVAYSPDGSMWLASYDGPWGDEQKFDSSLTLAQRSAFNQANRLLFETDGVDGVDFMVVDDTTGERVGSPIRSTGVPISGSISPDGAFIVLGFADEGIEPAEGAEFAGEIVVLDGETAVELFRVSGTSPSLSFAFDRFLNELLVGAAGGSITTIDLTTGKIVASVRTSLGPEILDIGIRNDGSVMVVSNDQIEVVDRRTGPTGETIRIPDSFIAELRVDELLFTVNAAQTRVETYDLSASALTQQTIPILGLSNTWFNGGSVVVTYTETFEVELIDLATGDRQAVPLVTADGEIFPSVLTMSRAGNFMAISDDGQVARWENGVMTDRINPSGETGARFFGSSASEERMAVGVILQDGSVETYLLKTDAEELEVLLTIGDDARTSGSLDDAGNFHLIFDDGTVRSYDSNGKFGGEIDTASVQEMGSGARGSAITDDGRLVAFAGPEGVLIVEPATGAVTRVPTFQVSATLEFARNGTVLIIGGQDGTVRTWDVENKVSRGVLWKGSSALSLDAWYDAESDSLWVSEQGRLVKLPLNPEVFLDRACEIVARGFTQDEWDQYVPGSGEVQSACGG